MTLQTWMAVAALSGLAGCAATSASAPDLAAKNRPLEQRCVRAQKSYGVANSRPPMTRAEIQAEAQAATRRGELDKACDWM